MSGRMPSAYLPLSARAIVKPSIILLHGIGTSGAQPKPLVYVWQSSLPNTGLQYPGGQIIVAVDINGSRQSQSVTSMRPRSVSGPGEGRQRWRHPFIRGRRRRSRKNTNVFAVGTARSSRTQFGAIRARSWANKVDGRRSGRYCRPEGLPASRQAHSSAKSPASQSFLVRFRRSSSSTFHRGPEAQQTGEEGHGEHGSMTRAEQPRTSAGRRRDLRRLPGVRVSGPTLPYASLPASAYTTVEDRSPVVALFTGCRTSSSGSGILQSGVRSSTAFGRSRLRRSTSSW